MLSILTDVQYVSASKMVTPQFVNGKKCPELTKMNGEYWASATNPTLFNFSF